jgi:copper chaperone CopZ
MVLSALGLPDVGPVLPISCGPAGNFAMASYKLRDLSFNTPSASRTQLEMALKRIQGVRSVSISVPRKEFTVTCKGEDPAIDVLKAACASAGFTLGK